MFAMSLKNLLQPGKSSGPESLVKFLPRAMERLLMVVMFGRGTGCEGAKLKNFWCRVGWDKSELMWW
jgi:hypothetical protein